MTDSTIPAFMRDLNVDAVAWCEARDGDFVLLRDPASRVDADVFVIDGKVTFTSEGAMHAYTRRVQGNFAPGSTSYTKASNRAFDSECWQVWRDFDAMLKAGVQR